jgi:hypothetical protein
MSSLLPAGTGETDKFGNMTVSSLGTQLEQDQALYHEQLHSFFSPSKAAIGANARASASMWLYHNSDLLRYTEEAMAETRAQLLTRSVTKLSARQAIGAGLTFPLRAGYGIRPGRLIVEGIGATSAAGGAVYGGYKIGQKINGR